MGSQLSPAPSQVGRGKTQRKTSQRLSGAPRPKPRNHSSSGHRDLNPTLLVDRRMGREKAALLSTSSLLCASGDKEKKATAWSPDQTNVAGKGAANTFLARLSSFHPVLHQSPP